MTTTSKRFSGPAALTISVATKYTCPADTVAVIRRIRVNPTDGSGAHTFTMSIGADSAGTELFSGAVVPVTGLDVWGPFSLAAGDIIQASGSSTALTLEIDGTETS